MSIAPPMLNATEALTVAEKKRTHWCCAESASTAQPSTTPRDKETATYPLHALIRTFTHHWLAAITDAYTATANLSAPCRRTMRNKARPAAAIRVPQLTGYETRLLSRVFARYPEAMIPKVTHEKLELSTYNDAACRTFIED